jgi:hypothetical protein
LNNNRDGFGKLVYFDGEIYEGHWVHNKREGKGTMLYQDGEKYVGEYKEG